MDRAAEVLRNGGVVAHACEGVWGLACDPFQEGAVEKILDVKQRDASKGLVLIGHDAGVFEPELTNLDLERHNEIRSTWPGHTTWVVPTTRFPACVTGGRTTIAIRVPDHHQARLLCARYGGPLVSTSANASSEPPARTESEVRSRFESQVQFTLAGEIGSAQGPSEIRDALSGARIR